MKRPTDIIGYVHKGAPPIFFHFAYDILKACWEDDACLRCDCNPVVSNGPSCNQQVPRPGDRAPLSVDGEFPGREKQPCSHIRINTFGSTNL